MNHAYIWVIVAIIILAALFSVFKAKIKGKAGEATIGMFLKNLDKEKYNVVNDVLLDSEGGNTKTTQVDHVVVSVYGIFSIETKNYKGMIYGYENAKEWTQNIYGNKYRFMNPIRQNYAHIKAIETLLKNNGYNDIPLHSIIAFPGDSTLKVTAEKAYVVKWGSVNDTIRKLSDKQCLSKEDIEKISLLLSEKKSAHSEMTQHVSGIKEAKADTKQKVQSGICPKCGGELVLRSGKYGNFYGCSNYPKCKFTAQTDKI